MPTVMILLNIVFITGVVVGILGLLSWGIISDRPELVQIEIKKRR